MRGEKEATDTALSCHLECPLSGLMAVITKTTSRMGVCANWPGRPGAEPSAGAEVGTELSHCVERSGEQTLELRGEVVWTQPLPSGPHGAPACLEPSPGTWASAC